ncbi:LSM domain-containing protein [Beauveria bassiana ARSEF 2860]|uniref:LSM domain-containing protein n=1 Tax=Beauveria bassiana (strain ARSEF 2860) TaxID=655819 RepID=J4WF22_BEAB2|nr:LSM domain-containing protein [Beauveria bassiana ARSEF 2860]EJP68570.1 LSM domain-containing protein [Beauveria bassiana ARSEF 2860]
MVCLAGLLTAVRTKTSAPLFPTNQKPEYKLQEAPLPDVKWPSMVARPSNSSQIIEKPFLLLDNYPPLLLSINIAFTLLRNIVRLYFVSWFSIVAAPQKALPALVNVFFLFSFNSYIHARTTHVMSERPAHRGGRGGRGDGGHHRGGGGRGGSARGGGEGGEKPKKENILDLTKYMDKQITVKFNGGREVMGTLKGFDALMNLVLDDVQETVRDEEGNESTRPLGLVVVRGTLLVLISPVDGSEEIANPFAQPDDE